MIKIIKSEDLLNVPQVAIRQWPGIIVHHTGGKAAPSKQWFFKGKIGKLYGEGIDRYHRDVKKWFRGMGYHILINPGGEPQIGDRWVYQQNGAHCRSHNDWLGVCFVGNFNWWNPTEFQFQTWRNIKAFFVGLPVYPHGKFDNKTECPGTGITVNYWFENIDL